MPASTSFGTWLRQKRRSLDLTQKAFADWVGCAPITLRRMEADEYKPSSELASVLFEKLGIPEPERLQWVRFARGLAECPTDQASPSSSRAQKTNLPIPLTSCVGREKEQQEIKQLILKQRLVNVVGVGGIGKTRLSIQTGFALLGDFPNGIWLIELAPLSDPALVPQAIVTTIGLIEQANRSPQTILTNFLQEKKSLLILDNCEHLIQACAELGETLLRACPALYILATSREALGIAGETVYHVPSLTTPDVSHSTLDTLSQYEAVQLFLERAQSAMNDFSLTQDNAPAIVQVCHRLDGIPLAIELAAARVRVLKVEEIAARLDDRFHLLTGGSRTALPRHQTLQAMIDWSYALLSEPERVLLWRLSIFAGSWTLEAAESVCASDGIDSHEILDVLTQLVNKSLIVVKREPGQETRYQMLETIGQYAREKLWQADEGEVLRQRHLTYFVELAERAEPNLRAFNMVLWLDKLETELDNIRVALEYALESNIEAQLRIASALLWFWWIRYHRNEGINWLEQGLSVEVTQRSGHPLTPSGAMLRGKALNARGFLIMWDLEAGKVAPLFEESLALFQGLGSAGKQGMAYALLRIGQLRLNGPRRENLVEQSLTLFREIGDKFGVTECLMYLAGNAQTNVNSQLFVEEQLALSREIGDQDGIAGAFESLANLVLMQDDYQRAIVLYEESLAGYRSVGNKGMVGFILSNLGKTAQALGEYELAAQRLEEALTMLQDFGMKKATAIALRRLGQLNLTLGNYAQAAQQCGEALILFRETESKDGIPTALYALGKLAWEGGDYDQAVKRYEEVLTMGREMENNFAIAYALYGLGKVAEAKGNYASARSYHTEGLTIRREKGNRRTIAYSLNALAALAVAQQKVAVAARLFGAIEDFQKLIQFTMSPRERAEHGEAIAAARAALGQEVFMKMWKAGKKMTLDEAVEYALES